MMVLIIKVPWIIARVESDSNFKYKAKETLPVKEKVSNGWVFHSMKPTVGQLGLQAASAKAPGPKNVGTR